MAELSPLEEFHQQLGITRAAPVQVEPVAESVPAEAVALDAVAPPAVSVAPLSVLDEFHQQLGITRGTPLPGAESGVPAMPGGVSGIPAPGLPPLPTGGGGGWEDIPSVYAATTPAAEMGTVERLSRHVVGGALGTAEGLGGAVQWITGGALGKDFSDYMGKLRKEVTPEGEASFIDQLASGVGSAVTFFIPGFGVYRGLGLATKLSVKAAQWLGAGTMAVTEAGTEAGQVYRNELEKGKDEGRASNAASWTFWLNLPVLAISDKLGLFSGGKTLSRALRGMVSEGSQESLQEVISTWSQEEQQNLKNILTSGAIGAIIGGGMGAIAKPPGVRAEPTPEPGPTPVPSGVERSAPTPEIEAVFGTLPVVATDAIRELVPRTGSQEQAERFFDLYQQGDVTTAQREFPELALGATEQQKRAAYGPALPPEPGTEAAPGVAVEPPPPTLPPGPPAAEVPPEVSVAADAAGAPFPDTKPVVRPDSPMGVTQDTVLPEAKPTPAKVIPGVKEVPAVAETPKTPAQPMSNIGDVTQAMGVKPPVVKPTAPVAAVPEPVPAEIPVQEAAVAPEGEVGGAKQPWEMTKDEFEEGIKGNITPLGKSEIAVELPDGRRLRFDDKPDRDPVDYARRLIVKDALDSGLPVPESVLAEYPDLTLTPPIAESEIVQQAGLEEVAPETQAPVEVAVPIQTREKKITEHEDIAGQTKINAVTYAKFQDAVKARDWAKVHEELHLSSANFTKDAFDHHFNPLNLMGRLVEGGMPQAEAKALVKEYEAQAFKPVREGAAVSTTAEKAGLEKVLPPGAREAVVEAKPVAKPGLPPGVREFQATRGTAGRVGVPKGILSPAARRAGKGENFQRAIERNDLAVLIHNLGGIDPKTIHDYVGAPEERQALGRMILKKGGLGPDEMIGEAKAHFPDQFGHFENADDMMRYFVDGRHKRNLNQGSLEKQIEEHDANVEDEAYRRGVSPKGLTGLAADVEREILAERAAIQSEPGPGEPLDLDSGWTEEKPALSPGTQKTNRLTARLDAIQSEFPDLDAKNLELVLKTFPDGPTEQIVKMAKDPKVFDQLRRQRLQKMSDSGGDSHQMQSLPGTGGLFEAPPPPKNGVKYSVKEARKLAPAFYSQMRSHMEAKLPGKGTGTDLANLVEGWGAKGQFKADELKTSGLIPWLREQTGPVTKQDVLDKLKEGEVQVKVVTKGEGMTAKEEKRLGELEQEAERVGIANMSQENTDELMDLVNREKLTEGAAKFQSYLTDLPESFTNRREMLLTVPYEKQTLRPERMVENGWVPKQIDNTWHLEKDGRLIPKTFVSREEAENYTTGVTKEVTLPENAYKVPDSHAYGDPAADVNRFAHVFLADYVDPATGKKSLVVTETQSDWAQSIRRLKDEIAAGMQAGHPPLPFAKNWHEVALKQAIRFAAENGYDGVMVVNGDMVKQRYDLSKKLDSLSYRKWPDSDNYGLEGKKDGEVVFQQLELPEAELEKYVGKEIAQRIIDGQGEAGDAQLKYLTGPDLQVGGEWATNLYDKTIPSYLKKYVKQWDSTVGKKDVGLPNEPYFVKEMPDGKWGVFALDDPSNAISIHSTDQIAYQNAARWLNDMEYDYKKVESLNLTHFPITAAMRDSVLYNGQPMFKVGEEALTKGEAPYKIGQEGEPDAKTGTATDSLPQSQDRSERLASDGKRLSGELESFRSRRSQEFDEGRLPPGDAALWQEVTFSPSLHESPEFQAITAAAKAVGIDEVLPITSNKINGCVFPEADGRSLMFLSDTHLGKSSLAKIADHELFHHRVNQKDAAALRLMRHVDLQSPEFKLFQQGKNLAYDNAGLPRLDTKGVVEELAADYTAGFTEYGGSDLSKAFLDVKNLNRFLKEYKSGKAQGALPEAIAPTKFKVKDENRQGQLIPGEPVPSFKEFEADLAKDDYARERELRDPANKLIPLYEGETYLGTRGGDFIKDAKGKTVKLTNEDIYERLYAPKTATLPPGTETAKPEDLLGTPEEPGPEGTVEKPPGYAGSLVRSLREKFSASNISEKARLAHQFIVEHLGWAAREVKKDAAILDKYSDRFGKMTQVDLIAFTDAAETGRLDQVAPDLQEAAQAWRNISDGLHSLLVDAKGGESAYWENYFPRLFKNPEQAAIAIAAMLKSRGTSLTGAESFNKVRTQLLFSDSIKSKEEGGLGLEPRYDNYVDMMKANLYEKMRFLTGKYIQADLIESRFITKKRTPGWEALTGDKTLEGYYAHPDVARVMENFLSKGLRGDPLFELYNSPVSFINTVLVGMSAFHATFSTFSDLAHGIGSNLTRAIGAAVTGRFGLSGHYLAEMGKAANIPANLMRGGKLGEEYTSPGTHPEMSAIVDLMTKAGIRFDSPGFKETLKAIFKPGGTSQTELGQMSKSFAEVATQQIGVPRKVMEAIAWPIMTYMVPRIKINATARLLQMELDILTREGKIKDMTPQDLTRLAQEVARKSDNIFGQMVYDNLSMKRGMRDGLRVLVGFPGWNIGSFTDILQAGKGIAHIGYQGGQALRDIASGRKPTWETMSRSDRMSMEFYLGTAMIMAVFGALMQKMLKGDWPEDAKDLFMPQTGELMANGQPERLRAPTYMRDVLSLNHPIEMVKHKLNFPLRMFSVLVDNQDFFGTQIRDPYAGAATQAGQVGKYVGKSLMPFGIQGYLATESPKARALNLIGITKVPRLYSNTAAMNVIDEYNKQNRAAMTSREAEEEKNLKGELRKLAKDQDEDGFKDAARAAMEVGHLTRQQIKTIVAESQAPPGLGRFVALPVEWQVRAWAKATDAEKAAWQPYFIKKVMSAKPEILIRNRDILDPTLREMGFDDAADAIQNLKISDKAGAFKLAGLGVRQPAGEMADIDTVDIAMAGEIAAQEAKLGTESKTRAKKNKYSFLGIQ